MELNEDLVVKGSITAETIQLPEQTLEHIRAAVQEDIPRPDDKLDAILAALNSLKDTLQTVVEKLDENQIL